MKHERVEVIFSQFERPAEGAYLVLGEDTSKHESFTAYGSYYTRETATKMVNLLAAVSREDQLTTWIFSVLDRNGEIIYKVSTDCEQAA